MACGGTPAHIDTAVPTLHAGQVVDGVPCLGQELPAYHEHVHVAIYIDGAAVAVPAGIGIGRPWTQDPGGFITGGSCFAWIHTHDTTGVVHLLSPSGQPFTLGQLFQLWGHPSGPMTVLVNGRKADGDPAAIPLTNLSNVVVEIGSPPRTPPPALFDFRALRA
jgi:hypothetical protein